MAKEIKRVGMITQRDDNPPPVPDAGVITRGHVGLRELPESGAISKVNDAEITLLFKGTKSALALVQPMRGALVTGYDGFEVARSNLTPGRGGLAELEIMLVPKPPMSGALLVPTVIRDQFDIDWMRIEKPIETAAFLGDAEEQAEAAVLLDLWRNSEPKLRAQFKYLDNAGAEADLEDKTLLAAKKIMQGVESYLEFVPVVQRIRAYRGRPTTGGCGQVEDPPQYVIEGYEFLKTADRLSDPGDGPVMRTEEWTGAIKWDEDLYPLPAGAEE